MHEASLHFCLLLADAGMLATICAVQWLIYPSFSYFNREQLIVWHQKYTLRIGLIVVPLMSLQLLGGAYRCLRRFEIQNIAYLAIILTLWALTFVIFVPLHRKISRGTASGNDLQKLVGQNRMRTLFWSIAFSWNTLLWYYPL
jgi:hypothetical protein